MPIARDKVRKVLGMNSSSAMALEEMSRRLKRPECELVERAVERMAMELWLEEPAGGEGST